jgi:gas vesicle protein
MGLVSGILRFLIGVGIGAAIGVALARLLTPRSAAEYQQLISERIDAVRSAGEQADAATRAAMQAAYDRAVTPDTASSTTP